MPSCSLCMKRAYTLAYLCTGTACVSPIKTSPDTCPDTHVPRAGPLYICVYQMGLIQGKVPFAFYFLTFQGEKCPAAASVK